MWTNTQRTSEHSRSPAAWPCPQLWGLRRAKWRVAILERSPRSLTMLPQVLLTSARDLERENREEGRTLPGGAWKQLRSRSPGPSSPSMTPVTHSRWSTSVNSISHPEGGSCSPACQGQTCSSGRGAEPSQCRARARGQGEWPLPSPSVATGCCQSPGAWDLGQLHVCAGLLIRRPIQARSRWLFQLPEQCVVSNERGTLGTTERCHCVCVTLFHLWTAALKVSENQTEKMFCCCCLKKSFQTNPESVL